MSSVIEAAPVTTPVAERLPLMGGANDLSGATSVDDALRLAGLDWEPVKADLFLSGGDAVPSHKAVRRSDNGEVLGVVGDKYQPVGNRQLAEFGQALVNEADIEWGVGGSVQGGKLAFLQFKLPGSVLIAGQDQVDNWVALSNGHTGNAAQRSIVVPQRYSCGNQVRSSSLAKGAAVLRHVGDIEGKVQEARDVLGLSLDYMAEFESIANRLAEIDVDLDFFEDFVEELLPINADAGVRSSLAVQRQRAALRQNWSATETLDPDLKATGWGALNVVTEVIDHGNLDVRKSKVPVGERRFLSSLSGSGAGLRERAYDLLLGEVEAPGQVREAARARRLLVGGGVE